MKITTTSVSSSVILVKGVMVELPKSRVQVLSRVLSNNKATPKNEHYAKKRRLSFINFQPSHFHYKVLLDITYIQMKNKVKIKN